MTSSIKSTPTENWDDDFLFQQLTTSQPRTRPSPSRSRTTDYSSVSNLNSNSRISSSGFGTQPRGNTGRSLTSGSLRPDPGPGPGTGSKSSPKTGITTRRSSGSFGSDLDGFSSDDDQNENVGEGEGERGMRMGSSKKMTSPWGARDEEEDDEPLEDWDEEFAPVHTHVPAPTPSLPAGSGSGSRTLMPTLGTKTGYKKNVSQSDLHELASSPHYGGSSGHEGQTIETAKNKKKEFRKSYHGPPPAPNGFGLDQDEMRSLGGLNSPPLPLAGPVLRGMIGSSRKLGTEVERRGSSTPRKVSPGALGSMLPPTSYNRNVDVVGEYPNRPIGKASKEISGAEGKKGTIMERVVSLHKRFSGSSGYGSRSDLSAIANGPSGFNGRPGLKVDTSSSSLSSMAGPMMRSPSSSRAGTVVSPTSSPPLNPSESTRSIHSLLSSSSSLSAPAANLLNTLRVVPDGLPSSSAACSQTRSGSTHTSSPSLVSAGFHLPSPSPASPYYQSQPRFQSPEPEDGDCGRETLGEEDDDDKEKTPRRGAGAVAVVRASMEVVDTERQVSRSSQRSGGTAGTIGTAQTVYMMDEKERDVRGIKRDEERFKGFKMGGYKEDQVAVLQRTGSGDRVLSPAGLPLPVDKKRKSTLKRLSSMGKRHGRKVSDGWRLVSGSSSNSNSTTTTTFERKSSDGSFVATPKTAPVSFRQQQMDRISPPRVTSGLGAPFSLAPPVTNHFATSSVRSMKQTPSSTSSSRISSDPQAVIRASNLAERNDGQQRSPSGSGVRRVSLSDLKIPSRVASAQKGVKEGMMNAKQFHESIKELKALVARRAILEAERAPNRSSLETTPSVPKSNLEAHWELAVLLIALGNTGTEDDDSTTKRERRITLASGRSSPAPLSPTGTPLDLPSRSDSKSNLSLPVSASEPARHPEWTATNQSTKRSELTARQLELLRGILESTGTGRTEPVPPLPPLPHKKPSETVTSAYRSTSTNRNVTSGRSSIKENLPVRPGLASSDLDQAGLRLQAPPNLNKLAKRRSSRSGFFNLRDMWRTSSSSGNPTLPPRSPISPGFDVSGRSYQRPEPLNLASSIPLRDSDSNPTPSTPSSTRTRTSKPPTSCSGTRPGLAGMFSRRSSMSSGMALSGGKTESPDGVSSRTGTSNRRSEEIQDKKKTRRKMKKDELDGFLPPTPPPPLPPLPLPLGPPLSAGKSLSGDTGAQNDRGITRSSTSSSTISDWDRSPSPESFGPAQSGGGREGVTGGRDVEVEAKVEVGVEVDRDRTIGRSDSRRMLASLGVRPDGGSPRAWAKGAHSPVSQTLTRPGQVINESTRDRSGQDRSVTGTRALGETTKTHPPLMVLAPENLGPLTSAAKGAVEKCRESLRLLEV